MNKNQVVFVTTDFVCHEYENDAHDTVITCYARENNRFRKISSGSEDTLSDECAIALDELIQDIGDPAFEMWDVPVYIDSDTTVTELETWYIRQIIARSNRDMTVPVQMERLYKSGRSYLLVSNEADEGWNYAFYALDDERILRLKDGGYIAGRITDPIDEIAHTAARRLQLVDALEKADISKDQLFEWIVEKEDMEYRGVKVFLSPELKADGIDAIPSETIDELKKMIDDCLLKALLLTHSPEQGYQMNFVDAAELDNKAHKEVPLPDGTVGILYFDPSVTAEPVNEYDDDWARELWLQDIHIRIRDGKHVLESE